MNNITKNLLLTPFNLLYRVSPRLDLELLFRLKLGYPLNLDDPRTYNEKLQWIKLYDHNPLMPVYCDKYAVREYVEKQGCGGILNRLIWQGFDPRDIPFDSLPKKCAIKVTHGSSFNILCTDSAALDRREVIDKCEKWLKARFLPCYGEWFYGQVKPRVVVEAFIDSTDGKDLRDYKIYCFNGEPRLVAVHSDRFGNHKKDLYDIDWNFQAEKYIGFPSTGTPIPRPALWSEALDCARALSRPFKHARVDLYLENGRIYFGEITFAPGSGFDRFSSYDFDLEMGSWLDLNK